MGGGEAVTEDCKPTCMTYFLSSFVLSSLFFLSFLFFPSSSFPAILRFPAQFFRSYFCLVGPFNYLSAMKVSYFVKR